MNFRDYVASLDRGEQQDQVDPKNEDEIVGGKQDGQGEDKSKVKSSGLSPVHHVRVSSNNLSKMQENPPTDSEENRVFAVYLKLSIEPTELDKFVIEKQKEKLDLELRVGSYDS